MQKEKEHSNPILSIIILFSYLLVGMIVSQLLVTVILPSFFDLSMSEVMQLLSDPEGQDDKRVFVLLFQFFSAFGLFILTPFVYCKIYGIEISELIEKPEKIELTIIPIITFIVILPFVAFLGEINSFLEFPSFMSSIEEWAKTTEEQLGKLTIYLLNFQNSGEFLLGFLVIAILPAVGEEYVFRGLIQNHLANIFKNPHMYIWLTAIIFGVFHMQFYGVLPRIVLGAVLGYMYFWSGNLLYPILGHLANNGFSVIMMYLHTSGRIEYNIESVESVPFMSSVVSLLLGSTILMFFRKNVLKSKNG